MVRRRGGWLLVGVLALALVIPGAWWGHRWGKRRHWRFRIEAMRHASKEEEFRSLAKVFREGRAFFADRDDQVMVESLDENLLSLQRYIDYKSFMNQKYANAAKFPWLPVGADPDPPAPPVEPARPPRLP